MRILLSYSRIHFDPARTPAEHKHWGSSASILARTLYRLLSELGEVTYIEGGEHRQHAGESYDLFVGIDRNFADILKQCRIKRSVLWAVNMHPVERNRLLRDFVKAAGLPDAAYSGWDIVDARASVQAIAGADAILCAGNIATFNSYLRQGVPPRKLKVLNYAVGESSRPFQGEGSAAPRFLHVTSEIGLRKGFDILADIFGAPDLLRHDFHLDVVGLPTNPHYEEKLRALQTTLGDRLTVHGWVDSATTAYQALMERADFLVFPTIEEGQAGTVLDAARHGVIPILSRHAGVDFSPLGFFELSPKSQANRDLLRSAMTLDLPGRRHLKAKTVEYYEELHLPFESNLRDSIRRCVAGSPYPPIDIVLPIFNKEHSITPLLTDMDRACRAYGDVQLHLILDGCVDRSEEVVRRFFRRGRPYRVSFDVTPNIFEVRSNNIGLKKATGTYAAVSQDDVHIYDPRLFFEVVTFLDKNPRAAILGTLAGVNYYPRGTTVQGPGQIAMNPNEVYWRQDAATDPALAHKIFEVDACMRGPLFFRKSFLETRGYLDEVYAPLYQDDMDICFRAKAAGQKVYCLLGRVENRSLTMAHYDAERWRFFDEVIRKNTDTFYNRWTPSIDKDYLSIERVGIESPPDRFGSERTRFLAALAGRLRRLGSRVKGKARRGLDRIRRP
jgi:GT2 family glycosyltransferase